MDTYVYVIYNDMRTIEKITSEKPIKFKIDEGMTFGDDFYRITKVSRFYDLNLNKIIVSVCVDYANVEDFDKPIWDDYQ